MRHLTIAFALLALACGGETTAPEPTVDQLLADASLEIVAGNLQADTIEARLTEALAARLTDGTGAAIAGAAVRYVVPQEGCGEAFLGHTTTDANGEAVDVWDLGETAGECTMEVRALDSQGTPRVVTTFSATIRPGRPHFSTYWVSDGYGAGIDSVLVNKATQGIEDRAGNALPFTITVLSGPFEATELEHDWTLKATREGEAGTGEVTTPAGVWLELLLDTCRDEQGRFFVRWTPANLAIPSGCPY